MQRWALGILVCALWAPLASACVHPEKGSAYHQKLRATIAPGVKLGKFSGNVLVARPAKSGGFDVFAESFAFADAECKVQNTIDTRFRIGSVTKQFTAAAILQFVEHGRFSLDTPVSKLLPGFPARGREARITIRHLLTHESGLPNVGPIYSEKTPGRPSLKRTSEAILSTMKRKGVGVPGKKFQYNNANYLLLGRILEVQSGLPYREYLARHLFSPAGMVHSGVGRLHHVAEEAIGYEHIQGKLLQAEDERGAASSGGIYSTVTDLFHWVTELNESDHILGKGLKSEMVRPAKGGYGLGIETSYYQIAGKKRRLLEHAGLMPGYSSQISYLPEERITIILLSNLEDSPLEQIQEELLRIALTSSF